ncbi:MAG: 3-isopropylmalate dehydratase small subunit [bacterium]|jgi:3-isopropylmalate/(R)-2-methylmalate dehydratase small subunit|nr:3-isopropylmalate dehydratase small subunit [bacterium]
MKLKGKVWKFKDNINTDEIIPARYLNTFDEQELAKHCMEDADKDFPKKVKTGDIIVAGKNFGCGSSREHAPICLKGAGVSCVIAETFARIFYRNAINIGLPILESVEASKSIEEGDTIEVDLEKGKIKNVTTNKTYSATAFPPFMQELINAGGLMEYVKKKI